MKMGGEKEKTDTSKEKNRKISKQKSIRKHVSFRSETCHKKLWEEKMKERRYNLYTTCRQESKRWVNALQESSRPWQSQEGKLQRSNGFQGEGKSRKHLEGGKRNNQGGKKRSAKE